MSITKLMTSPVECCTPGTDLAAAAMMMWRADCGIVPVVEPESRRVVGVITDRDICMAAGTRHQAICSIPVEEIMRRDIVTCRPSDSPRTALAQMAERRVRRAPVVDDEGRLVGMLSMADLIRAAQSAEGRQGAPVTAEDVLAALVGICRPRTVSDQVMMSRPGRRRRTSVAENTGPRSAQTAAR